MSHSGSLALPYRCIHSVLGHRRQYILYIHIYCVCVYTYVCGSVSFRLLFYSPSYSPLSIQPYFLSCVVHHCIIFSHVHCVMLRLSGATAVDPGRSASGIPVATPLTLWGVIIFPSLLSCMSWGCPCAASVAVCDESYHCGVYLFFPCRSAGGGGRGIRGREVPVHASAMRSGKVHPYHR